MSKRQQEREREREGEGEREGGGGNFAAIKLESAQTLLCGFCFVGYPW